jgi:anti-sigma factor RsiW
MNCQQCQEKILDALAAGANHVAPEIAAHQSSCPACARFFATQQSLLQSIDAALQSVVNQPVPPSLLPAVRARLCSVEPLNFVFPAWASVAALVLLGFLVSAPFLLRRASTSVDRVAVPSAQAQRGPARPQAATVIRNISPVSRSATSNTSSGKHNLVFQSARGPKRAQTVPDRKEQEALTALALAVQRQPEWGSALLHPAQMSTPDTAIPPIGIDRLVVTPITEESR